MKKIVLTQKNLATVHGWLLNFFRGENSAFTFHDFWGYFQPKEVIHKPTVLKIGISTMPYEMLAPELSFSGKEEAILEDLIHPAHIYVGKDAGTGGEILKPGMKLYLSSTTLVIRGRLAIYNKEPITTIIRKRQIDAGEKARLIELKQERQDYYDEWVEDFNNRED